MSTKTIAIAAIVLWAASAAFVGYKFLAGSTVQADDGREASVLTQSEKDLILTEKRGMLSAVRDTIAAANSGDMDADKEATHRVGMDETQQVPPQLILKLPLDFKQLGFAAHAGFDEVSQAAETGSAAVLGKLAENMARCVSCHDAYKLTVR